RIENRTAAVVVATTNGFGLTDYLSLSDMPVSEETYLVSSFRQFITTPSGLAKEDYRRIVSTEATKNCFVIGEGGGVYENYLGQMVMGHYSYVEPIHSCMISEIEMEEVMKPVVEIRNSVFVFAGVLILLVIALGFYIVRATFRPIESVVKAAREYGRGNLEHRVLVMGDNELGDLSTSINEMANEIKKSHLEISRHSQELEETVKRRTEELEKTVKKQRDTQTAMMNMLEDLNDAVTKLKSVDLMKDEFLNNAAHELKTPLIPILGYTELALGGKMGKIDEKERELLVIIERNANRLKTLVDDVLDISKLESGSMKFEMNRIDLSETIGQCVKDMEPAVKSKGIYLKLDAPGPVFVLGDQRRLTQVVVNLINNAMKFTDKGGISLFVSVDKQAGMTLVRVADTGIGLKEEDMKHLFEKFFQAETSADRKYAGSGLGLNICRGIIAAHGGEIWAETVFGKGTTFSFKIPLANRTTLPTTPHF
ncbi:MAG: HAMP domain-containing sensor histidine kinase, partial [Candidatus Micrarchaeota archaeon]